MCVNPVYVPKLSRYVDCCHCVECNLRHSQEWVNRLIIESKVWSCACVMTLTYNDDNLPVDRSLKYSDVQLFIKRLRKFIGVKIRYFACGEYGDRFQRPHYHLIIFGWCPDDMYSFGKDNAGNLIYRSPSLESKWQLGFSSVCELNEKTVRYCSNYLNNAFNYDFGGRVKPFVHMSRGIGENAINPDILTRGLWLSGRKIAIPRYFFKRLKDSNPEALEAYKARLLERVCSDVLASYVGDDHVSERLVALDSEAQRISASGYDEKYIKWFVRGVERTKRLLVRRMRLRDVFKNNLDCAYRICVHLSKHKHSYLMR